MSVGSDTADQVVRQSIQVTESAVKLAGLGAKNLAAMLLALSKEIHKTKGKTNLSRLLAEGRPLKVVRLKTDDLKTFGGECIQYGALYTAIRDKTATDGIQGIIRDNSHDEMRFEYTNHGYRRTDNWIDVLAVYAIKTANADDNGIDVTEIDEARAEKLRNVFWDMQAVTWEVVNEPIYDAETDTSTDHYVLYLRAECIGANDAADTYGFDHAQQEILDEMLSGEYDGLFNEMIGSAGLFRAIGDGGAVLGTGNFIWPSEASTYVRSPYGSRPGVGVGDFHYGIDIAAGENTAVLASDAGTVISSSVHSSYGNHLLIDHGNGYSTLYGHMNTLFVGVGDTVERGQVIGLCGNTGVSYGAHIHFEVRINGSPVNPLQFFSNYTC